MICCEFILMSALTNPRLGGQEDALISMRGVEFAPLAIGISRDRLQGRSPVRISADVVSRITETGASSARSLLSLPTNCTENVSLEPLRISAGIDGENWA